MTAELSAPIDSYRFSLPEQWINLTPDREAIDKAQKQCLQNIEEAGLTISKTDVRKIEVTFGQLRRRMLDGGVTNLALFADAIKMADEDDDKQEEPANVVENRETEGGPNANLITSALTVQHVSKESLGTEFSLNPKLLQAIFMMKKPASEAVKQDATFVDLEPAEVDELPAGPSLRLRRLLEYRQGIASVTKVFTETYMVPHDDSYETMTLMQFSTPSLELAPNFSPLFHSIAETLVFLREGDPSNPEETTED